MRTIASAMRCRVERLEQCLRTRTDADRRPQRLDWFPQPATTEEWERQLQEDQEFVKLREQGVAPSLPVPAVPRTFLEYRLKYESERGTHRG